MISRDRAKNHGMSGDSSPVTTNFSEVEPEKENIKPIPQGRSVRKLAQISHTDHFKLKQKRAKERIDLQNHLLPEYLSTLDDPLDPYLHYLSWIRENFPKGDSSGELIKVLEKTTHDFKDDDYYKNEIRYFKVWLEYIKFSDTPRDIYTYLSRKGIGSRLSIFYENYAKYLEENEEYESASRLYQKGLKIRARPMAKLQKAYQSFLERKAKWDEELTETMGSVKTSKPTSLSRQRKFLVFKDNDDNEETNTVSSFDSTRLLHSIAVEQKENKCAASSFQGEKIPQSTNASTTKRAKKFTVYQDSKAPKYPVTKTMKTAGNKTIKYDFNFDLFFPLKEEPRSIYEVLTLMMRRKKKVLKRKAIFEDLDDTGSTITSTNSVKRQRLSTTPSSRRTTGLSSSLMLGAFNDDGDSTKLTKSPTLTYFSKQAHEEILEMFNQSITPTTKNVSKPIRDEDKSEDDNTGSFSSLSLSPLMISLDRIVNPFSLEERKRLLQDIKPKLEKKAGYHNVDTQMVFDSPPCQVSIGAEKYQVTYLSKDQDSTYLTGGNYTIKRSKKSLCWNYHILTSLADKMLNHRFDGTKYFQYTGGSYLILKQPTTATFSQLIRIISLVSEENRESLSAYFTVQMLQQILNLHSAGYLHCGISPSTGLISFNETLAKRELSYKDISMGGLENAVDLSMYGKDVHYTGEPSELSNGLMSFINKDSWKYEPDYIALAGMIHMLMTGLPLNSHKIHVTKGWNNQIWMKLFGLLIESKKKSVQPQLETIMHQMEQLVRVTANPRHLIDEVQVLNEALTTEG